MSNPRLSLTEIQIRAEALLSKDTSEYLNAGMAPGEAGCENVAAWRRLKLQPGVFRSATSADLSLELFGTRLKTPVLLAPTGRATRFHPDGEAALLTAADKAGAGVLTASSILHGVADLRRMFPRSCIWQQFYLTEDRSFMADRLGAIQKAGVAAAVVTADLLPGGSDAHAKISAAPRAAWEPPTTPSPPPLFTSAGLEDLEWFCAESSIPVVVKGVLRADDAKRCIEAGAKGVIVSNHGGNQLTDALATAEALPAVADSCAGNALVLVDGGIRTGACVFKALALGADAVMIGRPGSYGLAAAGADGVASVLEQLALALERTMLLCGAKRLDNVTRDFLPD